MRTNQQKANEIAVTIMSEGHLEKNGMCQRRDLERAAMEMAQWKDAHVKVVLKDMLRTYYDAPDAYPEMPRSEDEVIESVATKLNINLDYE